VNTQGATDAEDALESRFKLLKTRAIALFQDVGLADAEIGE
jgi:hypothetical protein